MPKNLIKIVETISCGCVSFTLRIETVKRSFHWNFAGLNVISISTYFFQNFIPAKFLTSKNEPAKVANNCLFIATKIVER